MSYNITLSDGTTQVTIPANTVVNNEFDIPLVGRNWSGYGDEIAKAFLHMLEHFSNDTEPVNPTPGQIWHDSSDDSVYIRNAADNAWLPLLSVDNNGDLTICGNILPCQDVTYDLGSPSLRWDQVYGQYFHGTASSAEYADLAERYEADQSYPNGTLVKIGGEKEITETTQRGDDAFSVISTAPAYQMNSKAGPNSTHPYVTMSGRVPVRVTGKIEKGQRLVPSNVAGVAEGMRNTDPQDLSIGKALEDKTSTGEGMVLAFVNARS